MSDINVSIFEADKNNFVKVNGYFVSIKYNEDDNFIVDEYDNWYNNYDYTLFLETQINSDQETYLYFHNGILGQYNQTHGSFIDMQPFRIHFHYYKFLIVETSNIREENYPPYPLTFKI